LFVCVSKNAGFSRKNSPVHGLLMLIYPWFFDTHHSPFIFTSFFNLYITFLYLIFCFVWEIWTNHLEHVYSCQMFHSWNLDVPWKTFVLSKKDCAARCSLLGNDPYAPGRDRDPKTLQLRDRLGRCWLGHNWTALIGKNLRENEIRYGMIRHNKAIGFWASIFRQTHTVYHGAWWYTILYYIVLWMEKKSCTPLDGWNPTNNGMFTT
jgi:hypothetical protein